MNPRLIESKKWFQVLVALLSLAGAIMCYVLVDAVLPASTGGARLALLLLAWGAFFGFDRFLKLVLPVVFLKAWPGLEAPDRPTGTS